MGVSFRTPTARVGRGRAQSPRPNRVQRVGVTLVVGDDDPEHALVSLFGACPYRRTSGHFAGTCAGAIRAGRWPGGAARRHEKPRDSNAVAGLSAFNKSARPQSVTPVNRPRTPGMLRLHPTGCKRRPVRADRDPQKSRAVGDQPEWLPRARGASFLRAKKERAAPAARKVSIRRDLGTS